MKKGFTLIELLIVMVIVGVLVAVAIPKYNASVERSRALEGILNLEKLSEEANAMYIVNKNSYPSQSELNNFNTTDQVIKSIYFNSPVLTRSSASSVTISIARKTDSGYSYTLTIVNTNGEPGNITCSGTDCDMISVNLTK